MKRMSKLALALVLVLAMSAGFSACGGGGDFDASTMTIGSSTSVDTLNPLSSYEQQSFEIIALVYDPLVRYDKELNPSPAPVSYTHLDDYHWRKRRNQQRSDCRNRYSRV